MNLVYRMYFSVRTDEEIFGIDKETFMNSRPEVLLKNLRSYLKSPKSYNIPVAVIYLRNTPWKGTARITCYETCFSVSNNYSCLIRCNGTLDDTINQFFKITLKGCCNIKEDIVQPTTQGGKL